MWKFVVFTICSWFVATNARNSYDDERLKCIERAQSQFRSMPKVLKIKINDNLVAPDGFNESFSIINLSVSRSSVHLPLLNISYRNLMILDSSYNGLDGIDDIGNETFPSLRLFNLSNNALSSVRSHLFDHLKELEILDLSHNCFVQFQYDHVFLQHENLKHLLLSHNRLHSIQSTLREPRAMTLQYLDFSHNFIKEFSNYELQINHLNAQNNRLQGLAVFHAEGMILNAQNNEIRHLYSPRGTFRILNLSHNKLEYLSDVEVEEAIVLDLSWNEIDGWASLDYFEANDKSEDWNPSLENIGKVSMKLNLQQYVGLRTKFVNLAHNEFDSFAELRHLRDYIEVNLDSNKLSRFSPETIEKLSPTLKRLHLIDNKFPKSTIKEIENFKRNNSKVEIILEKKPLIVSIHPLVLPTISPLLFQHLTTEKAEALQTSTMRPSTQKAILERTSRSTTTTEKPQNTTTESTRPETTDTSPEDIPATDNDENYSTAWIYALLFAGAIIITISLLAYREHRKGLNFMYQEFNDGENAL